MEKGVYNFYEYMRLIYLKCGFYDVKLNEKNVVIGYFYFKIIYFFK